MSTPATFGHVFRKYRQAAKKTLGDVARHLGVSVSFVSDVEHERRNPFRAEHLLMSAELFGIDATILLSAAAHQRGGLTVAPKDEARLDVVAGLARSIDDLSSEQLAELRRILNGEKRHVP